MDFREKIKELINQHDKEVRDRAIDEFYAAISNHYKIYRCVPSMGFISEIAENLKGKCE